MVVDQVDAVAVSLEYQQLSPGLLERVTQGLCQAASYLKRRGIEYSIYGFLRDLIQERPGGNLDFVFNFANVNGSERELVEAAFNHFAGQISRLGEQLSRVNPDEETKTRWAQLNQEIAVGLFHSLVGDHEREGGAVSFARIVEIFGNSSLRGRECFRQFLSGVKAQAGLMECLAKEGYAIIPLNWQDTEEIKAFDLKGVDFIAVHKALGITFLIDAKGRKYREMDFHSYELVVNKVVGCSLLYSQFSEEWLSRLQGKLEIACQEGLLPDRRALVRRMVRHLELVLPTSAEHLDGHGRIVDGRIKQEVVSKLERYEK